MTLKQFKSLEKEERYLRWLSASVEVASYEASGFLYVLYQLDSFYIEMRVLKTMPENVLFVAFDDDEYKLNPYLERINISAMLV